MRMEPNHSEDYIFEQPSVYEVTKNEVILNKKILTTKESIQYFLNKYENVLAEEIRSVENKNMEEVINFINTLSKDIIKTIPLELSLYANEELEKYRYEITKKFQLLESKMIINDHESSDYLIDHLKNELLTCNSFDIIVSFIKGSGLNMLISTLDILEKRGIPGRIITSTYMNVTEPNVLRTLSKYKNITLKIYQSEKLEDSFHTKAYLFHRNNNLSSVIVGSSNITGAALKTGEEWNVRTYEKASDSIYPSMLRRFDTLWGNEQTIFIDEKFITKYEYFLNSQKVVTPYLKSFNFNKERSNGNNIEPNSMQKTALKNLVDSVQKGHTKGLAIAATGTGKTFLSAMCAKQLEPRNILFIAHRVEILQSALEAFRTIFSDEDENNFSLYKGQARALNKFTFASIQSLANDLEKIEKAEFDFIVVDEFHHATSPTYLKTIEHFTPDFMLGLTATPERTDGADVYELMEYNIISDIRLKDALESELLVPFQYYGISDDTIDLAETKGISREQMVNKLNTNRRVDFIIEKMNQYTPSGPTRCIGFCQTKEHANYMHEEFARRGYHTAVLTSNNTDFERNEAIQQLESKHHPLEIIFVVDLFNEGTDIPAINLILFLRPTESAIIFTQQLGRGLRKSKNKDYLVVLDFVTNDRNSYLVPIALSGNKEFMEKSKLKSLVTGNFDNLSSTVHIDMDYKTKERILEAIDQQNFMAAQFIKKEAKQFLEVLRFETKNNERKIEIMDFYNYENAPSTSIIFKGAYQNLSQLNKAIKEERTVDLIINENKVLTTIFNELTKLLPIKRLYDMLFILYALKNKKVSEEDIKNSVERTYSITLNTQALKKIHYAKIRVSKILSGKNTVFNIKNEQLTFYTTISKEVFTEVERYITYTLASYRHDHNVEILNQKKELELYKEYQRFEVAALVGFDKDLSSWRDGVREYKDNHYLFVNLKKDESLVEEHLMYDDYFISNELFHWQSQNKTSQESEVGQKYMHHKENGQKIHLFVRRENEEDRRTLPFYYLGELDFIKAEGNKPISITWRLHHRVPKDIRDELEY